MSTTTAPPQLAKLDYRHGVICVAVLPGGTRCSSRARYVTAAGDPVCGHHTSPGQATALWQEK